MQVSADLINVQKLNSQLQKNKQTWVAKESHLTQMTKAQAQRMMGLRRDTLREAEFIEPVSLVKANLPAMVDWRNKDGKNWVSPILDQGNCGSCVAFAAVGVLETQYKIASLLPTMNIKLSPQHLFACGGGGCDSGWYPSSAANFIQKKGVPDEACSPYISGATGQDVACQASCANAPQRSLKISSFTTPTRGSKNIQAVKQALQTGPVVTTLDVYADFMAYAGGVYQHTTGEALGGHAISIVGYDDSKQAFIIRNSWGQTWGENGFGYVSYSDYSGVGDETWLYNIPALAGAISINSPNDYDYVTGSLPFKSESTYQTTEAQTVTIYNTQGKSVWNDTCAGVSCDRGIDVSGLPDGRYEIDSVALDNKGIGIGKSTRHIFYVVNQAPQFSMKYAGVNGTDLNRDLKGRIEVQINSTTSSVPFSSVEFHRRGPDGKEDMRASSVVPSQLTMGWRTNLVPNGKYEIWFVGKLKSNGLDLSLESEHKMVNLKN